MKKRSVRGSRSGRPIMALGFVELGETAGYGLTPLGRELRGNFLPLHRFAERWSKRKGD